MMYTYLRELKARAGDPTNAEIAEKSGVPESTIAKMMSGTVDNPRFQSVVDVVMALGGSLDELVGIVSAQPERPEPAAPAGSAAPVDEHRQYIEKLQQIADESQAREERLRAEFRERERQIRAEYAEREQRARRREIVLFIALCALVLFIMIVLLIDVTHSTIGFFRYAAAMMPNSGEIVNFIRRIT